MSDLDISFLFKERSTPELFSIWYDPVNGKITGMAPHTPEDAGIFVIDSGDICVSLLSGDIPFKEYVVAYDPKTETSRLMHINDWGKLLGEKHELQLVSFMAEQDNTMQFFLNFYRDVSQCELLVNHDSFANMFKQGNENQISQSQRQTISFFVREKETGYLVAKHDFEFDINNDIIMEDGAGWLREFGPDDVDILSHKNFCTYSWSCQEKKIDRVVRVNRTRVIPASRGEDYSHINFRMHKKKLICDSNIGDPSNYNIHDDLKVWITQHQHPDALIGMIKVPITMLKDRGSFEIDINHLNGFDFNDVDFLSDNQYIKLHMRETA